MKASLLTLMHSAQIIDVADDAQKMDQNLRDFEETIQLVSSPYELTEAVTGNYRVSSPS